MAIDLVGTKRTKTSLVCPKCPGNPLIRVTRPKDDTNPALDWIVCNICGGGGDYERVLHLNEGLEPKALTPEGIADLMSEFGLYWQKW